MPDTVKADEIVLKKKAQHRAMVQPVNEPSAPGEAMRAVALLRMVTPPAEEPERRSFGGPPANLPPMRPAMADLLAALDDPSFATRTEASRRLQDDVAIREGELVTMLWAAKSPEQVRRLRAEHRRRFDTTPRAAIGISFGNEENGVARSRINMIYDNFPAKDQGELRIGDIIVSVAGVSPYDPVTGAFDLGRIQSAILSHNHGDIVEIIVQREYEHGTFMGAINRAVGLYQLDQSVRIDVPLGAWARLGQRVDQRRMERLLANAWRMRAQRLGVPHGSPTVYHNRGSKPTEQARAAASNRGPRITDVLPPDIFRTEHVRGFDSRAHEEKIRAEQQREARLRARQMLERRRNPHRAAIDQGAFDRWKSNGRGPDGEWATSITVVERTNKAERRYSEETGSPLELARRVAQVRANARAQRTLARDAETPEARDAALDRARHLDAQAAQLAERLAAENAGDEQSTDAGR